jgi:hypothetical protein
LTDDPFPLIIVRQSITVNLRGHMERFLEAPRKVPFDSIHLDPNNPRLGLDDAPGYEDASALLDPERQKRAEKLLSRVYDVDALAEAIVGQGWMPIDNIVVWMHPKRADKSVVTEGNTRTLALRKIRGPMLERETKKLRRMEEGGTSRYAAADIEAQRRRVESLKQIVADTANLEVVPLAATTVEELQRKLPRVLAVRHITGAKQWGNYAEDLWLLQRYQHLFEEKHGDKELYWDQDLVRRVAEEASLSPTATKRQLRSASAYSHFRAEFEDRLPEGEEFQASDYYLFENIVKKPFVRNALGLGEDDRHIPAEAEEALFGWVFKKPRGRNADQNENVFYRHENVVLWDQMKRYDDQHGTSFASRFDIGDYQNAPTMQEVEAEYVAHKARKKPQAVIDELLRRLKELPAEILLSEGEFLKTQLEQLHEQSGLFLRMVRAVNA